MTTLKAKALLQNLAIILVDLGNQLAAQSNAIAPLRDKLVSYEEERSRLEDRSLSEAGVWQQRQLKSPRTECQHHACVLKLAFDKQRSEHIPVLRRICHDPCYLDGSTPAGEVYKYCAAFQESDFCLVCSHHGKEHARVETEWFMVKGTQLDPVISQKVKDLWMDTDHTMASIRRREAIVEQYRREYGKIARTCSRLHEYIQMISSSPSGTASATTFWDQLIADERLLVENGKRRSQLEAIQKHKLTIQDDQFLIPSEEPGRSEILSLSEAYRDIACLHTLEHYGAWVKQSTDAIIQAKINPFMQEDGQSSEPSRDEARPYGSTNVADNAFAVLGDVAKLELHYHGRGAG